MRTRQVGRSGLLVSELAFGTMSFGGDADECTSTAMYARCRDRGVTTFDCADVYNEGRSEEILGRCFAGHRDEVVITTKAYFPTGPGANDRSSSRYHLVRAVDASLRRLRTDRIDIFFLHRFDDRTPLDESLRAVHDMTAAGKILYLGLSNFAAWQVAKALGAAEAAGWARAICTQPMYNLLKRQAEVEILPLCANDGVGVFPYSPLAGGLLTGKYVEPDATGRLSVNAMYRKRYEADHYHRAAADLRGIASRVGVAPATLAIAWVGSHPAVTAPLIGARNVAQLDTCLDAGGLDLDPEVRAEITALTPDPPPATDRSEERTALTYEAALLRRN